MDGSGELFEKLKLCADEIGAVDADTIDTILNNIRKKQEPFDDKAIQNAVEGIMALIKIDDQEIKGKILQMIAEIAKSEETRVALAKTGLIAELLSSLESENANVVLQALRAIGNISCENERAKSVLMESKGAEKIVKKLEILEKSFDEKSDNRVEFAACGSMLNITSDDDALADEAVSFGAISFLLGFAKQSILSNPSLCRMALSAVSHLASSEKAKAVFCETDALEILMKVLEDSDDEEMTESVFETLRSLVTDDNVKKAMVHHGCAENLANIVASCRTQLQDEAVQFKLQAAADMIVMLLTEDEGMRALFGDGNGIVLKECISWLGSGDAHLEVSGALALGNFGRTDDHCIKLVELGVHKHLLQLLAATLRKENTSKQQLAVFSALKNLSMPAVNKAVLVEGGCLNVILPLLSSQSPFVQFKVLGTLRMLLMGPGMVANKISENSEQLKTIVRCIETSGHEGVKSEASRILALLARQGKSKEVSKKIMKCGGLAPIVAMVSCHHDIMQNEALIGLATMSSTLEAEFYPMFRDSGVIQTLVKIIKTQGTNPQTCYNSMAVLESFSLREYFRRDLQVAGFSKALDELTNHENDNVKKRALIILTRIKAQKIMEEE